MKTSNIILLAFLLFVFLTPIVVLEIFKKKIRNNEFTLVEHSELIGEKPASRHFEPYRFVRISSPVAGLHCAIQPADNVQSVTHGGNGNDSLHIYNNGDTLVVQLVYNGKVTYDRYEYYADLFLPSLQQLQVSNAEVTVAGNLSKGSLVIDLANNAEFGIGESNDNDRTADTSRLQVASLSATVSNSSLFIRGNTQVPELNITANGGSSISIDPLVKIDRFSGSIAPSASVNANWQTIQQITAASLKK